MDSDKKATYLMPFCPISGLISMSSLTYFMKIMLDGHGRQLKSPKSKKFRGRNRGTLSSPVPNHFHLSLLLSQMYLIILKLEQKKLKETVQN